APIRMRASRSFTFPAGSSRVRERGFIASIWRSITRLSASAVVRAPTPAIATSNQRTKPIWPPTAQNTPARISRNNKSVSSKRTNGADGVRLAGTAVAVWAVVIARVGTGGGWPAAGAAPGRASPGAAGGPASLAGRVAGDHRGRRARARDPELAGKTLPA